MTEPTIDKYVDAARRELRVRAWNQQQHHAAFRELMRRREKRSSSLGPFKLAAAGLALAAVVLLAIVGLRAKPGPELRAVAPAANAPQRIALGEGTEVSFERGAELDVRERSEARVIVGLQAGAARFKVRHEPRRLFLVRAAEVEVEDNGTIFDVENKGDVVAVSVSEGSVSVSFQPANGTPRQRIELKAGERGVYPAQAAGSKGPSASTASVAQAPSALPAASADSNLDSKSQTSSDSSPSASPPAADWRVLARAGKKKMKNKMRE